MKDKIYMLFAFLLTAAMFAIFALAVASLQDSRTINIRADIASLKSNLAEITDDVSRLYTSADYDYLRLKQENTGLRKAFTELTKCELRQSETDKGLFVYAYCDIKPPEVKLYDETGKAGK